MENFINNNFVIINTIIYSISFYVLLSGYLKSRRSKKIIDEKFNETVKNLLSDHNRNLHLKNIDAKHKMKLIDELFEFETKLK